MSQGNASRVSIGTGTSGTSDVFSATLPLDTRWDILPNCVRIYKGNPGSYSSWGGQSLVALDNGNPPPNNIVGQGAYAGVTGDLNYQTGAIQIRENGVAAFGINEDCWVEYYERWPGNSPADDFWVAYGAAASSHDPLILHRFDHASFANRNLVNHGQWCMRARQAYAEEARAEFILKDPDFYTDRPVMSEIAIRAGNDAGSMGGCYHGPLLCQRRMVLDPTFDTGYYFGPYQPSGSTQWYIAMMSGSITAADSFYYAEPEFAGSLRAQEPNNAVLQRWFNATIDNTPPNILADDWHKFRMVTTFDSDPGDIHIHLLMALGHTEVDKAVPNFQTFADVWHQFGNNTAIVQNGFASVGSSPWSWNSRNPQAYPPDKGYQGFLVGRVGPPWPNQSTYFDDFRCYRMP